MDDPKPIPSIPAADRKLLEFFARDAFPPVEATADGLVTVKMTSRFELTEVRIRQDASDKPEPAAIEKAVQKAVNAAIRDVADRNAKRLNQYAADPPKGQL